MKTSAEIRKAKLKYYDRKVTGYMAYINFWVWGILFFCIVDFIYGASLHMSILAGAGHIFTILFVVIAAIFIRDADKTAYWINISMLSWMILKSVIYMGYHSERSVFLATESIGGSSGVSGAFSALFDGILSMAGSIAAMGYQLICIILAITYLVLFTKHKKFFVTSAKELKRAYLNDLDA